VNRDEPNATVCDNLGRKVGESDGRRHHGQRGVNPSDLGALQAFLAFLEGAQIGWICMHKIYPVTSCT
jgi:hypothetical protein